MTNAQLKEKPQAPTYKQQPTIGGSIYIKPQDMEWTPTQLDKVSIKVLYENKELGESTVLLKLEPGATVPFHKHPELEQALVLEGSMYDHDGHCGKGEYVWRKANSFHENRTDEGAIVFAVYRKQNVFVNNRLATTPNSRARSEAAGWSERTKIPHATTPRAAHRHRHAEATGGNFSSGESHEHDRTG